MRFVSVRELRSQSARLWQELPLEREVVVTNNGRPVAILSAVGERDLEASLSAVRRARAAQALQAIQLASVANGTDDMTMAEIDDLIREVRRERSERGDR